MEMHPCEIFSHFDLSLQSHLTSLSLLQSQQTSLRDFVYPHLTSALLIASSSVPREDEAGLGSRRCVCDAVNEIFLKLLGTKVSERTTERYATRLAVRSMESLGVLVLQCMLQLLWLILACNNDTCSSIILVDDSTNVRTS